MFAGRANEQWLRMLSTKVEHIISKEYVGPEVRHEMRSCRHFGDRAYVVSPRSHNVRC